MLSHICIDVAIAITSAVATGAFTDTVVVSVTEPAELLATSVYVVVTVGEYDCDPLAATELPFIVTDVAFVVAHVHVTDWPLTIVADAGVNNAVGVATGGGRGAVPGPVPLKLVESSRVPLPSPRVW